MRRGVVRRWVVRVVVCLLLGAVVNVAVAWGCVVCGPSSLTTPGTGAHTYASDLFGYPTFVSGDFDIRVLGYQQVELTNAGSGMQGANVWRAEFAHRAGWPMFAVSGTSFGEYRDQRPSELPSRWLLEFGQPASTLRVELPYRLVWPGSAINTVFYAVMLWLLFAAPFTLRRRRRVRKGLCVKCAYPVGESDICTECGRAVR